MALQLKSVPASRGPRWIGDAIRLYARRPLGFSAMFVVFLFAALVVAQVPLLGGLVQMMSLPLLSLGFMVASQSALLDGPVGPSQFIEPLRTDAVRRRSLLVLCVMYGIAALCILLLADAISNNAWGRLQRLIAQGDPAQQEIDALLSEPGVGVGVLLGLALGSLLSVPFWHAPALVHWGGQGVKQALFSSTVALWRTKAAFGTYMLAWVGLMAGFGLVTALVFGLLGAPQMAGLVGVPAGLVFSAVFYISLLFTFNDSFGGGSTGKAELTPPP
jgi:hypothetical protein